MQERLIALGTPAAEEAVHAYVSAVTAATAGTFSLPETTKTRTEIARAINTHSKAKTVSEGLAWLRRKVAEWVKLQLEADEAKFTAGWSPSKFNDWLGEQKGDRGPGSSNRRVLREISEADL